jgi:hypothetical protein
MGSDCALHVQGGASIAGNVYPEDFRLGRSGWRSLWSACKLCIADFLSDSRDSFAHPSNLSNAIRESKIRRRDFYLRHWNRFADVRSRSLVLAPSCQDAALSRPPRDLLVVDGASFATAGDPYEIEVNLGLRNLICPKQSRFVPQKCAFVPRKCLKSMLRVSENEGPVALGSCKISCRRLALRILLNAFASLSYAAALFAQARSFGARYRQLR